MIHNFIIIKSKLFIIDFIIFLPFCRCLCIIARSYQVKIHQQENRRHHWPPVCKEKGRGRIAAYKALPEKNKKIFKMAKKKLRRH